MKNKLALILALFLAMTAFSSCGDAEDSSQAGGFGGMLAGGQDTSSGASDNNGGGLAGMLGDSQEAAETDTGTSGGGLAGILGEPGASETTTTTTTAAPAAAVSPELVGTWTLSCAMDGEGYYDMSTYSAQGKYVTLTVNADGTGTLDQFGTQFPVTADGSFIKSDADGSLLVGSNSYSAVGNTLTITDGAQTMSFTKGAPGGTGAGTVTTYDWGDDDWDWGDDDWDWGDDDWDWGDDDDDDGGDTEGKLMISGSFTLKEYKVNGQSIDLAANGIGSVTMSFNSDGTGTLSGGNGSAGFTYTKTTLTTSDGVTSQLKMDGQYVYVTQTDGSNEYVMIFE